MLAGVHVTYCG